MGAAKMKRAATTAEIQKPALALSAGHVSIGNPFGPSVVANANAAAGTMVPKADLIPRLNLWHMLLALCNRGV
jgi:hypothetical protein